MGVGWAAVATAALNEAEARLSGEGDRGGGGLTGG